MHLACQHVWANEKVVSTEQHASAPQRTDDLASGLDDELIVAEAHEHQLRDRAGQRRHVLAVGLLRHQFTCKVKPDITPEQSSHPSLVMSAVRLGLWGYSKQEPF